MSPLSPTLSVAHEVRAIARDTTAEMHIVGEWDWWITTRGDLLHAATVEYDPNYELAGNGVTECSRRTFLMVPGLFSRTERPRCPRCCTRLGYPQGKGSPKNDQACRPLVEARLAARSERTAAGRG